ncbi:type II toxin-antitoxin system RelE/ParE family toxin [Rhodopseudomonas pseudopalustris]|uniref:Toxin n=1 Tax=Rhodopseudomonas pseudopalustris TaxID=1513892 RepID=A0A1H8NTY6_9BRAD|nr:type II toxin-antitoxin system RelE/ParE family toxin [Rhodopseudomonas pseudopalustris]SEO32798.1 toxin ParE1/3/4 [Rhodopseudomonas pseudopalustris]
MANSQTRRPQAREDLIEIWLFIADDNESAASSVVHRIDRTIQMLAENPKAGRERPELGNNIRSFPVGNYSVFYLPDGNGVEVVRILHASRDITAEDID